MRNLVLLSMACAAVLAAACGGKSSSSPGTAASTPPTAIVTAPAQPASTRAPVASPGCGSAHKAGASAETLVSDKLTRSYRLYVPKGYDASKPVALVLNFHGLGGSAQLQELNTGIRAEADTNGFVALSPDGTESPRRWHLLRSDAADAIDDFAFIRKLIDTTSASLCIDQSRIYAMGMSDGAFFSSVLACELNDKLAAVGPVAGAPFYAAACANKPPMPIIAFHGTADTVVPFEGGMATTFVVNLKGARENLKAWAGFDGCQGEATSTSVAADVTLESYAGCKGGSKVQLYVIQNGGHTWPGAAQVRRNGATTQSIKATDLIWRFFAAHPKA